ncbi:MAG: hypothetical protein HQL47_09395, partial [Gammaproteobacteria bacterium]|nr:hypothetical protein [Gammaproteobacteria bacterium]
TLTKPPDLPPVLLIAEGWDYPQWQAFYPEDLPPEWRLAFYGNVFRGVLLPLQGLLAVSEVDGGLAAVRAEVQERFRFYLPAGLPAEHLASYRQALGEQFGGQLRGVDSPEQVLADTAERCFRLQTGAKLDLRQLRRLVECLQQRAEDGTPSVLLVAGNPPDFAQLQQCQTLLELMGIA